MDGNKVDLRQIEKESDKRVKRLLDKTLKAEAENFVAQGHLSIEVMPHTDKEVTFRQQGRRVSWGKANDRYVAARHYPNEECARTILEELRRLGAAICSSDSQMEQEESQLNLF